MTADRIPIPVPPPAGAPERLTDPATAPLPPGFVERLGAACPVSVAADELHDAGRDWWPLAMVWAHHGLVAHRPQVIARPSSADEVVAVLRLATEDGVPVTPAAGRSGVCGGAIAVRGGIALDLTGLAGLRSVHHDDLVIDVGAGTFGHHLEDELRADHDLTLGHWPQSIELSTVGGWLACRSAGQYSTRYGKIEDMVAGLDVVLADGRIIHTDNGPRAAVGPDLTQLFVGSEGTLGVITGARLRVWPLPHAERRDAWSFPSFAEGLDVCRRILRRGATPAVLRLYDHDESRRTFDHDGALLLVLDEGDAGLIAAVMDVVDDECRRSRVAERVGAAPVTRWLAHRNDVSALGRLIPQGLVVDTMEIAAPWSALARLFDDVRAAIASVPGTVAATCHQSHAYPDGACLYFTFAGAPPGGQPWTVDEAEAYYRAVWDAGTRPALAGGARLSHHHGVGVNRAGYVADALGSAASVLAVLKQALDPAGILNPGTLGLG